MPDPEKQSGGTGGDAIGGRNRDVLRILQSAVTRGHDVGAGPLAKAIKLANDMLDTGEPRDQLRAGEFLASLTNKGIDVAMYLDKNERIDEGKHTESVKHDHAVVVKGVDMEAL